MKEEKKDFVLPSRERRGVQTYPARKYLENKPAAAYALPSIWVLDPPSTESHGALLPTRPSADLACSMKRPLPSR